MKLDKFINRNSELVCINFYNNNYKENELVDGCNLLIDNKFKNVSFVEKHSDFIWKNVEKKKISTSYLLDNSKNKFDGIELFLKIKEVCAIGVNCIEYIPVKDISYEKLEKEISQIFKAKFKRVKLFIVLPTSVFDNLELVKSFIKNAIDNEMINGVKISSGLKNDYADFFMVNTLFEEIEKSNRMNFEAILCLKLFDDNDFLQSENAFRLARYILGDEWLEHCLTFSFDFDIFKNRLINI